MADLPFPGPPGDAIDGVELVGPRSFTPEAYQAALSAAQRGEVLVLRSGRALGLSYTDVYRDRVAPGRRVATLTPEQGDSLKRHMAKEGL